MMSNRELGLAGHYINSSGIELLESESEESIANGSPANPSLKGLPQGYRGLSYPHHSLLRIIFRGNLNLGIMIATPSETIIVV